MTLRSGSGQATAITAPRTTRPANCAGCRRARRPLCGEHWRLFRLWLAGDYALSLAWKGGDVIDRESLLNRWAVREYRYAE